MDLCGQAQLEIPEPIFFINCMHPVQPQTGHHHLQEDFSQFWTLKSSPPWRSCPRPRCCTSWSSACSTMNSTISSSSRVKMAEHYGLFLDGSNPYENIGHQLLKAQCTQRWKGEVHQRACLIFDRMNFSLFQQSNVFTQKWKIPLNYSIWIDIQMV